MKKKKVKILRSKVAYSCPYLRIIEEDFTFSGKKVHRYYLLKRNDYVIVIAKEGEYFYFIEQYRYPTKSYLIQVVAGGIEKGETPITAARKELKEEAGITAGKMKKIGWLYAYYGPSNQKAHVFFAEDLSFGKQDLKGLEKESDVKVKKYTLSEIKEMIKSNRIKDEDTLSAFCIYMLKYDN
jgi:8-oxo-dGTP pyrophosphatase MutT (NUDIX family)